MTTPRRGRPPLPQHATLGGSNRSYHARGPFAALALASLPSASVASSHRNGHGSASRMGRSGKASVSGETPSAAGRSRSPAPSGRHLACARRASQRLPSRPSTGSLRLPCCPRRLGCETIRDRPPDAASRAPAPGGHPVQGIFSRKLVFQETSFPKEAAPPGSCSPRSQLGMARREVMATGLSILPPSWSRRVVSAPEVLPTPASTQSSMGAGQGANKPKIAARRACRARRAEQKFCRREPSHSGQDEGGPYVSRGRCPSTGAAQERLPCR